MPPRLRKAVAAFALLAGVVVIVSELIRPGDAWERSFWIFIAALLVLLSLAELFSFGGKAK